MTYTTTCGSGVTDDDLPKIKSADDSLLLTVTEAAAALRISRSSIYRLFDAGELAWVKIGSSRRVTSAEIHRFVTAHTRAAS
jgi:excisionase family DNA binding protein